MRKRILILFISFLLFMLSFILIDIFFIKDRDVDIMIMITDPSKMGLETAKRIRDLANEVHINFQKIVLVGNMFPPGIGEKLQEQVESLNMELGGVIPLDPNVASFSMAGRPLLELPDDSPAVLAVEKILEKIGLL